MGHVSEFLIASTVFPINATKKYERYHVSKFLVAGTVFPIKVTKKITERYGKIGRGVFAHTRSSREAARVS